MPTRRDHVVSLLLKTGVLCTAVYLGQRLGLAGVARDLGPVVTMSAIMMTEAAKSYIGETGAASFADAFVHPKEHKKEHDPHRQIRNHDIHEVAGVAIQTLVEVYAKEHSEDSEKVWLTDRLKRHFKTRWDAFDPNTTPELDFLQGRFVTSLYKDGPEALHDSERLKSGDWETLLLYMLTGMDEAALVAEGSDSPERIAGLVAFVEANYATAFTYLLRHNQKAGYGVLLFLQSELLKQTGEIHASIKALANPQPELNRFENLRATDNRNVVYLFERQISPFHGYASTCDALQEFLNGQGLRWARLTGRAGTGKSRVALELMRYAASQGWQTGFLRRDHAFNAWESWKPLVPTLIVVDYALHRKTHIGNNEIGLGQLLELLQARLAELEVPVRVLLVDRDREPHVWARFFEGTSSVVQEDEHKDDALHLAPLAPEHRLAILREELVRLETRVPSDLPDVLTRLEQRLKEPARPLFLLFAARGIAEGGDENDWSAEGLVEVVLRLEKRHWYEDGVNGAHLNALVLATLVGSYTLSDLSTEQKLAASLPLVADDDLLTTLCALGDGYNDTVGELTGIRPDLLGELLILQRLAGEFLLNGQISRSNQEISKAGVIAQTKALITLAWAINPIATAEYLDRTIEDYLFDRVYAPTVELLCQKPTTEVAVRFWSHFVAPRLLFEWAGRGMLDKARLCLVEIQGISRALAAYARGLYNATTDATSVTQATPYLNELRELAKQNPQNKEIKIELANGLTNTSSAATSVTQAIPYLNELRELANNFPEEGGILNLLFRGGRSPR